MALQLRYRSPTGETRPWTIKEIIQGKPVDRPTHPMLVHFPIAFYLGALGLDVLSRIGTFPFAPTAATWLIFAAIVGSAAAATTGLVDRSTMKPGSRVRTMATRHMLFQYAALVFFLVSLIVRWSDRHQAESSVAWILLEAVGVLVMAIGADIGGQMVYKLGYRVGPGE